MRTPVLTILLAISLLAPRAGGQEVLPPEDRDAIQPEREESRTPETPTEVTEEHTVITGDTLWDLCGQYLKNPWYWPRVWSYNPEITNPHWIYPGQVVRFYAGGEGPGQLIQAGGEIDVPVPEGLDLEDEMLSPEEMVTTSGEIQQAKQISALDIRRTSFVTEGQYEAMGTVRASREEVELLHEFNSIYIDFKDLGAVQVGDQFAVYRTKEELEHPVTGKTLGYHTEVRGICQITNLAETSAVAIIASSRRSIERGDKVGPLPENFTRDVRPRPNEVELRGYIVGTAIHQLVTIGERHLEFIDQGTEQGVQEGNLFDVVRREDGLFMPGEGKEEGKWDKSMPAEIYGRVMVVDARPQASTGVVLASMRELRRGDRLLMSVR